VNQLKFRSLAVAIASSGLQYYVRGIFETRNSNINHGVTLVGYEPSRGVLN
jgi:hypothetical protein